MGGKNPQESTQHVGLESWSGFPTLIGLGESDGLSIEASC